MRVSYTHKLFVYIFLLMLLLSCRLHEYSGGLIKNVNLKRNEVGGKTLVNIDDELEVRARCNVRDRPQNLQHCSLPKENLLQLSPFSERNSVGKIHNFSAFAYYFFNGILQMEIFP